MIDQILCGDALTVLAGFPEACVDMCVTSPPYYGLRDYGVNGQIGLEASPEEYVAKLVAVFHEVKRVLEDDGTLWLNLGDSYAGSGKGLYGDGNSYGTEGDKQKTNVGSIGVRMGTKEGDPGHTHGIKPPNGYKAKAITYLTQNKGD